MDNLRVRPDNNFFDMASGEQMYTLTKHWQSDMEFYSYEMSFLKKLINKYFIWMSDHKNLDRVRNLVNKLSNLKKEQESLEKSIRKQLNFLQLLLENSFSRDQQVFRDDQLILEGKLVDFLKSFKSIKKEVFEITEDALDSEKLHYLIEKI
jgi:hypothetical protein